MALSTSRSPLIQGCAAAIHAGPCLDGGARAAERADPWIDQLALSLAVEAGTLAEFRGLMRQQGFGPEMSRFFLDLAYAYRQLAIAHSLGVPRLRILALDLFEACQRLDQRRRQLSEPSPAH